MRGGLSFFMQHLQPEFLPPGYMLRLWNTRLLSVGLRQHDVLRDGRGPVIFHSLTAAAGSGHNRS
jgi:hypothetical protein